MSIALFIEPENELPQSGGFMRYYGLFWKKELLFEDAGLMPGLPQGWLGKGNVKASDRNKHWVNCWQQKGVYVLYDRDLQPVYAGQAGLERTTKGTAANQGRTIGERLKIHKNGKYRNGWEYFSWFGFLDIKEPNEFVGKLKRVSQESRRSAEWVFSEAAGQQKQLNALLDSFEAILIEAFSPRFNARGGNLKGTTYVDQLELLPDVLETTQDR